MLGLFLVAETAKRRQFSSNRNPRKTLNVQHRDKASKLTVAFWPLLVVCDVCLCATSILSNRLKFHKDLYNVTNINICLLATFEYEDISLGISPHVAASLEHIGLNLPDLAVSHQAARGFCGVGIHEDIHLILSQSLRLTFGK